MSLVMRRMVAGALCVLWTAAIVLAVDGDKAMYVGGTIPNIKEKAEGRLSVHDDVLLRFQAKEGAFETTYASIKSLEYGQKAGRRVGVAIMISPLALFSKKRKHYLTLTYTDAAGRSKLAYLN